MKNRHASNNILSLCLTALFAALICVCTFISVPLPLGYFNLGDVAMLLGAYVLGFPAAISAAIGASMADVLMGFAVYAPATAIIKGLCVLTACTILLLTKRFPHKKRFWLVRLILSSVTAEVVMVAGYLLFEALVLGYGAAALASVLGNCMQGFCGIVGSITIYGALKLSGAVSFIKKLSHRSDKLNI